MCEKHDELTRRLMRLYNTRIDDEQLERMHESMEGCTLAEKLEYSTLESLVERCSGCSSYVRVRAYGDAPD